MKKTTENIVEAVETQECKCEAPCQTTIDSIVRKRVYASMAAGLVPIPLVDFAALTAIQIEMVRTLCIEYGIPFEKQWVKTCISGLCGGGVTVAAVPTIASLFKAIPVIGLPLAASTISITGGAITYAVGCVFNRHFKNGGSLGDFDVEKGKTYFKEKYEEGKTYVKGLKSTPQKEEENTAENATNA